MSPAKKGKEPDKVRPNSPLKIHKKSEKVEKHQKKISAREALLWNYIDRYLNDGPQLGERFSMGLWDRAYMEDSFERDVISNIDDQKRRLAKLESWAKAIAKLGIMEVHAKDDDKTLLELVKFDLRYFALPAFLDRLMYAKLYSTQPPIRKVDVQEENRDFLVQVSEIIKAAPKGPMTAIRDFRGHYRSLVDRIQRIYDEQVEPLLKEKDIGVKRRVLENYIKTQLQVHIRERDRGSYGSLLDVVHLFEKVKGQSQSEKDFITYLLDKKYSDLAKLIIMAETGLSVRGLKDRLAPKDNTSKRHLNEGFGFRNWEIVEQWYKKHYGNVDPFLIFNDTQDK